MQNPFAGVTTADTAAATIGRVNRRRAVPRSPHRVPCRLRALGSPTETGWVACGQTVNVSPGGVAIQLSKPVRVGTRVEVQLPPLEGRPLLVRGSVVHSRRVLTGTFEIGILQSRQDDPPWV